MKNQEQEVSKGVQQMNDRYDDLMKQIDDLGASGHGYSKESMITIPGTLFATFLNLISHTKQSLEGLDKTLEINENVLAQARQAIAVLNNNTAIMAIDLIEQHVTNIKAGSTTSQEVLDVEDAEQKIQEVK